MFFMLISQNLPAVSSLSIIVRKMVVCCGGRLCVVSLSDRRLMDKSGFVIRCEYTFGIRHDAINANTIVIMTLIVAAAQIGFRLYFCSWLCKSSKVVIEILVT